MSRSVTDRRLRLIDAMVLISMVALGLAMAAQPYRELDHEMIAVQDGADYRAWTLGRYYGALAFPCVTPLTLAIPLLGLRRPRGRLAQVLLGPGLGGCVAASAALLVRGLEYLPYYVNKISWHLGPIEPWVVTGDKVGYAVVGAWAILAVARRFRLGPGWLDRIGFVVALVWAIGAVAPVLVVLGIRGMEMVS
jgi:hypothetical protein